ncbi:MAG: hypothetical protein V1857_02725 [archaeon]
MRSRYSGRLFITAVTIVLAISFAEMLGGTTQGALMTSTSAATYAITEYSTTTSIVVQTEKRGQWFSVDGSILASAAEVQLNMRIRNLSNQRLSRVALAIVLELADGTYSKPLWLDVGDLNPEESTNYNKSIRVDLTFNIVPNVRQGSFHSMRAIIGESTTTWTRTITDYAVFVRQPRETQTAARESENIYLDVYTFFAVAWGSIILLVIAVVGISARSRIIRRKKKTVTP